MGYPNRYARYCKEVEGISGAVDQGGHGSTVLGSELDHSGALTFIIQVGNSLYHLGVSMHYCTLSAAVPFAPNVKSSD